MYVIIMNELEKKYSTYMQFIRQIAKSSEILSSMFSLTTLI